PFEMTPPPAVTNGMSRPCVIRSTVMTPVVRIWWPDPSLTSAVAVTLRLLNGPVSTELKTVTKLPRVASMPLVAALVNRSGVCVTSKPNSAAYRDPNRRARRNPKLPPFSRDAAADPRTLSSAVMRDEERNAAATWFSSFDPSPKSHVLSRRVESPRRGENEAPTGSVSALPLLGVEVNIPPPCASTSHLPAPACAYVGDGAMANAVKTASANV